MKVYHAYFIVYFFPYCSLFAYATYFMVEFGIQVIMEKIVLWQQYAKKITESNFASFVSNMK